MAVTKNDVLDAIEQLESNDQNPTNANILAIVGGSNATVQKYRSEIMSERQQQAFKSRIVLKDNELSKLTNTFNDLLANRLGEHNSELSTVIAQLETSNSELSNNLDQALSDLAIANKKIENLTSTIKELETKISFADERFEIERQTITKEKDKLNDEIKIYLKDIGKIELLQSQNKQLETENRELKVMIDNAKSEEARKPTARKQEKLPLDRE